jgi:hypothetical protein
MQNSFTAIKFRQIFVMVLLDILSGCRNIISQKYFIYVLQQGKNEKMIN